MAHKLYNINSNSCAHSPSAEAAASDAYPYVSRHERLAQGAFKTTLCDSSSGDSKAKTFSSNVAQQDDTESRTATNDTSARQKFGSTVKRVGHRSAILPDYEKPFFDSENASQPCVCPCHDWSINNGLAAPQREEELTPLKRWIAERPSEGASVSHWQHRRNLSPCKACSCHRKMGRSAHRADDSSDDDEKRKGDAGSRLDDRKTRG
jgi:hypothetical protein